MAKSLKSKPVNVGFFIRQKRAENHSIEFLFTEIAKGLPLGFKAIWLEAPYPSTGIWNRIKLIWWAYKNRQDINHVTGDIHFINLLLPTRSTVLTIHDLEFLEKANGVRRAVLYLFWVWLPLKRSNYVTTVSHESKKKIANVSCYSSENIDVIYNFVDDQYANGVRPEFAAESPKLLQIGTKANKNIKRLIKAISGLKVELHIVGKPSACHLEQLKKMKVPYEVYIGLTNRELIELYYRVDLLTYISTTEGFGLPIVEAQCCRLPVLTSSTSCMPEIGGDGALYCDPYSVSSIRSNLEKLINNEGLRHKLVEQGVANAARFSLDATVRGYAQVYQRIIEGW